ncbi:hypothetical protein F5884DRAFT_753033 [Xylogone sp. PMI_703]|nr:hypothetical protein F5884DRAFT_753033 [Xylogone sp. PMI_703]
MDPSDDISDLCIRKDRKWDNGSTIKVGFLNGPAALRYYTIYYAGQWFKDIHLYLKHVENLEEAQIRIEFTDNGSKSRLGTSCLDVKDHRIPTMWLAPNEGIFTRTVWHEFGHALGCVHEHQSPAANIQWNRAAVYQHYGDGKIYTTPSSRKKVDANLFSQPRREDVEYTQFDEHSIMMYPIEAAHTLNGFHAEENYTLSTIDKEAIRQFYPKEPKQDIPRQ